MALLLILALIVAFAIAGGIVVSKFLFLVLLVALVLAAFGLFSRGTAKDEAAGERPRLDGLRVLPTLGRTSIGLLGRQRPARRALSALRLTLASTPIERSESHVAG